MKILHVIGYLAQEMGGPVASLKLLAECQSELGHNVKIAHTSRRKDGDILDFNKSIDLISLISFSPLRIPFFMLERILKKGYKPDIIHIHGLWFNFVMDSFKLGIQLNIPIVISPCGMLQQKALERSKLKKWIILKFYLRKLLESSKITFHSKSIEEKIQIKFFLPLSNVIVIPNPVEIYDKKILESNRKNQFIFLGRLHPVKGLERLIHDWKKIYKLNKNWDLLIIGPDTKGYKNKLVNEFDLNQFNFNIKFIDTAKGQDKWSYLRTGKYFIMPSKFENFGSAIVEGMSAGLPIITTAQTPWSIIKKRECGWIVEDNLYEILKSAINLEEFKRQGMGANARELSYEYSAKKITNEMIGFYESAIKKVQ